MTEQTGIVDLGYETVADAFFATVRDDERSGAGLSIWKDGRQVVELWGGVADYRTGREFAPETLSVVFSCTKGLASILIGMLIERGQIPSLETPWRSCGRSLHSMAKSVSALETPWGTGLGFPRRGRMFRRMSLGTVWLLRTFLQPRSRCGARARIISTTP